jgi:hypothetical protein
MIAGVVVGVVPNDSQAEGFALFFGGGVAIALLNVLYRIGVSGEDERDREEEARAYFDEHGRWPDEEPQPRAREWSLPMNVVTPPEGKRREREDPHRR